MSHAQLLIRQQTLFFSDFTLENHVIQLQNLKKITVNNPHPPAPPKFKNLRLTNALNKFMVWGWATFIALLGCM